MSKSYEGHARKMHGGSKVPDFTRLDGGGCSSVALLFAALAGVGGWYAKDVYTTQLRNARSEASKMEAAKAWAFFILNKYYPKDQWLDDTATRDDIRKRYVDIKNRQTVVPSAVEAIDDASKKAGQGGIISALQQSASLLSNALLDKFAGDSEAKITNRIEAAIDINRFQYDSVILAQDKLLARWAVEYLTGKCDSTCDF